MSRTTRLTRRLLGAHIQVYFVDGDASITEPATVREPGKMVFLFETTHTKVALEEECVFLSRRHTGHTVIGILGDTRPDSATVTSVCVLTPGADKGAPLSEATMEYLDVRLGSEEATAIKLREFPPFADIEAVEKGAV